MEEQGKKYMQDSEDLTKLQSEIKIISQFLPKQMNDEEIKKVIKELVQELQAESIKDLGKLMQLVKERYPGQFDMKKAADLGKNILS